MAMIEQAAELKLRLAVMDQDLYPHQPPIGTRQSRLPRVVEFDGAATAPARAEERGRKAAQLTELPCHRFQARQDGAGRRTARTRQQRSGDRRVITITDAMEDPHLFGVGSGYV
jgi:hypothetical protein